MATRRFLSTHPQFVARFGDPFRPLEADCKLIQFSQPLTHAQLRAANELIADRPEVQLYVYGQASRDLDFLGFFPNLKRLDVSLYYLENIDGFASVGGLELLVFGKTKKTLPLGFLAAMTRLDTLFLEGHRKELAVVGGLTGLTSLGLRGITLPDLSLLMPLTRLRDLRLLMGSTNNLALLPALPALEDLFLMRLTGLEDVGVVADLKGLTTLRLDWMRNVTTLPSFAGLTRLEELNLDTMKGLTDLAPAAAAPNLRRLKIQTMPQLTAESFRCFVGHPTLKEMFAYTGRNPVNAAVKAMFPGIAR
jgi:internalin A